MEPVVEDAEITVFRWESEKQGTLYARVWGGKQKERPVLQHQAGANALRSAGLATPEILFSDCSTRTALRWGLEAIIESSAPGVALHSALFDTSLPVMARELAGLHMVEGEGWGRPWFAGQSPRQPPLAEWRAQIRRFRKRVTPSSSLLSADEIDRSLNRLGRGLEAQAGRRPALTHGDLFHGHVFVDEKSGLTWIDFETVEYTIPERDLGTLGLWLRPHQFDRFMELYEEARGAPVDRYHLNTSLLLAQWKRLYKRVRQSRDVAGLNGLSPKKRKQQDQNRVDVQEAIRNLLAAEAESPLPPPA